MSTTPPAGWFPDPSGLWEFRFWDGVSWTEHVTTGLCQSTEAFPSPPPTPGHPNQVLHSAEGISERTTARLDLTWYTLNFIPTVRLHESRAWPLGFVVDVGCNGQSADGPGDLRFTLRGQGYVGPSTVIVEKIARAHWVRAIILRQRALVAGWPPR